MKIGTISLNINAPDFNYGAVLHSWAFQQFLLSLDNVKYTEIIDYTMPSLEGQNLAKPLITALKKMRIKTMFRQIKTLGIYKERYKKFSNFEKKYMQISAKKYTQKTLEKESLDYQCIVCESDVIWAPGFSGGHFDKTFFLALDSMRKMNKVAYAPSMSDGELSSEQVKELEELLKYPDYISCRESYEKDILEKYTDKEITHVLDPVMLLNAKDYYLICDKPIIEDSYLLLYLPVDDNDKLRQYARKYAKKYGLKILEISTKQVTYYKEDEICLGAAGVEEFLSAIRYSNIVFTNSFHAICFSIIFNVQFYAFSRAYAGKVKDICKIFELENRYFSNDVFKECENIDFDNVNKIWETKRTDSKKWLIEAINKKI